MQIFLHRSGRQLLYSGPAPRKRRKLFALDRETLGHVQAKQTAS